MGHVSIDIAAARDFVTMNARVLDRRRLALLLGDGDAAGVLGALEAHRNADGGYGWGLEPDLRTPESQPGAALHAFEAFAEAGVATVRAVELCDWLASVSLPDGGVPFALPVADTAGSAPWWLDADGSQSSLQITAATVSTAALTARHDPAIAGHAWYTAAVDYCMREIAALDEQPHAIVVKFVLDVLDAVHDSHPEAPALLARIGEHVPADGRIHVAGGTADEFIAPLDMAPLADRPVRALFDPAVIDAALEELTAGQQADGGWPVVYATQSPASQLEWRGILTVRALHILRAAGRA